MLAPRGAVGVTIAAVAGAATIGSRPHGHSIKVTSTAPVERVGVYIPARIRRRMDRSAGAQHAVGRVGPDVTTRVRRGVNGSGRALDAVGSGYRVSWLCHGRRYGCGGGVVRGGRSGESVFPEELLHEGASSVGDGSVTGMGQWSDSHGFWADSAP